MLGSKIEFLSISKGITRPYTIDNSIIAQNRNIDHLPPQELTMHAHPYFSLTYIIECDNFTHHLNGCEVISESRQLILQPPNTLHTPTNKFKGKRNSISIRFNINDENLKKQIPKDPCISYCSNDLAKLILKTSDFENNPLSNEQLQHNISKILELFLASPYKKIIVDKAHIENSNNFIGLIKHMYENYDRNITLKDMAEFSHMEATYFAKKFKSTYNISPINYLYSVRLFRSLDILMFTNLPIAVIAEKVGFKNVAAFCTAFRRAYGLSPSEYRKEAQSRKFDVVL